MLAPILPNPIIASCMTSFSISAEARPAAAASRRYSFAVVENGRAGHQHIGSGGNDERRSRCIDAAVHLEAALGLDPIDHRPRTPDLREVVAKNG